MEQDAKAARDRRISFPMTPVLQHDLSGADLLSAEDENNIAPGTDGAWRIAGLGRQSFDQLIIEAIDGPAVTRGRILRQAYPDRFSPVDIHCPAVVHFNQR